MDNVRWDNLRPEVRQHFLTQFKSITVVSMRDVKFHSLGDLLRLIRGFPYLRTLHLRRIQWEVESEWAFSPNAVTQDACCAVPILRELTVYEAPSSSWFLNGLFDSGEMKCERELRRIGLDWGDGQEDDLSILNNLVRASRSLHTLELDLSWHGEFNYVHRGQLCRPYNSKFFPS